MRSRNVVSHTSYDHDHDIDLKNISSSDVEAIKSKGFEDDDDDELKKTNIIVMIKNPRIILCLGILLGVVLSIFIHHIDAKPIQNVHKNVKHVYRAHNEARKEYLKRYREAYLESILSSSANVASKEEERNTSDDEIIRTGSTADIEVDNTITEQEVTMPKESKTTAENDKFGLVISVYKEKEFQDGKVPMWADHSVSRDNYFVVHPFYQKLNPEEPNFLVNKGYESGTYLRYIVDNYSDLPEAVIFTQADGCDSDMNNILSRLTLEHLRKAEGYLPLNCLKVIGRGLSMWGSKGINKRDRVESCWREVASHFGRNIFDGITVGEEFRINMVCCSCFAVSKSLLMSTPLSVWKSFYERAIVGGSCVEGREDIDKGEHETRGAFEHLAHVLFGRKDPLWEPKCFKDFEESAGVIATSDEKEEEEEEEVRPSVVFASTSDKIVFRTLENGKHVSSASAVALKEEEELNTSNYEVISSTSTADIERENTIAEEEESRPTAAFSYAEVEEYKVLRDKIFKNQYPNSCSRACFYSASFDWPAGFGSFMQVMTALIATAVEDGCVLIAMPDSSAMLKSMWAANSPLEAVTNCSIEDAKNVTYLEKGTDDFDGILSKYFRYAPQFDDLHWEVTIAMWQHVASSFLMRPINSFQKEIDQVQIALGWHDENRCKNSVISMHVRHGDKGLEAKLLAFSDYIEELNKWWDQVGKSQKQMFSCIFIATDDKDLQESFNDSPYIESKNGHRYRVLGLWQNDVANGVEKYKDGGMLTDLFLLSKGSVFLFTFSSNFGTLAMNMNPVHLLPPKMRHFLPTLVPLDFYCHAIASGFFLVCQNVENEEVRTERNECFWSIVPVYKTQIYNVLKCDPAKNCHVPLGNAGLRVGDLIWPRDSCPSELCSCCNVSLSDFDRMTGPNLQRAFPAEFKEFAKDSIR